MRVPAAIRRGVQVTYERYGDVLKDLSQGSARLAGLPLLDVAFGSRPPAFADAVPAWRQEGPRDLDDTQRAAVDLVLAAKDIALIHGPPGARTFRTLQSAELAWPQAPQALARMPP